MATQFTMTVRVLLMGDAPELGRRIIQRTVQQALVSLGHKIEGDLRRASPRRTGRTAAGWQTRILSEGDTEALTYRFTVANPAPGAFWVARYIGLRLHAGAKALADVTRLFLLDQLQTANLAARRVELLSESREEIVLAIYA